MRAGIVVSVTPEDRIRLEAIVADRNTRQKHAARARVIVATADGCGTAEIMRRSGLSKPVVWRWQERFMHEGVDGLLRDKTRKPGKPPLPAATVQRVLDLTLADPPGETTHWSVRAMAKAAGIGAVSVQRIWQANGLTPHRMKTFKLSNDAKLAEKFADVVGLYVDPPAHAVVLSIDEKSQIQALDRTQPGLPMKKGRAGTMTHDYIRNGTTTLFAALNVLDGTVIGRNMQRHRHQEFIRFLNQIEAAVPAGKTVHAIVDNYATHKHPKVRAWLARHPRWTFHFTPTSASWLNAVEGFFSALTRRRLKRGVFCSLVDLQAAINRYVAEHNKHPKPFAWTADPDRVLAAIARGKQVLESLHEIRVLMIPAEHFRGNRRRCFELTRACNELLSRHWRLMVDQVVDLKLNSVEVRLGRFLARRISEEAGAGCASLPEPRSAITARLGMTPETLSRTLAALEGSSRLRRTPGGPTVSDRSALLGRPSAARGRQRAPRPR